MKERKGENREKKHNNHENMIDQIMRERERERERDRK